MDSCGFVLDASQRLCLPRPERAWRVRGAALALHGQGRAVGQVVEVFLGHVAFLFGLAPHLFSILEALYTFVHEHPQQVGSFCQRCLSELLAIANVAPFVQRDMALPCDDIILCSDASKAGYALHSTPASSADVEYLARVNERWRFKPERSRDAAYVARQCQPLLVPITRFEKATAGLIEPEERAERRRQQAYATDRLVKTEGPLADDYRALLHDVFDDDLLANQHDRPRFCPSAVPRIPDSITVPDRWTRVVVGLG